MDWAGYGRAQNALGTTTTGDYEIHDEISIKKTSFKETFQHYTNKKKIDEIFCRRSPS